MLFCRHYSDFNDPFEFWTKIREGIPDRHNEKKRFLDAIQTMGLTEKILQEDPLLDQEEFFASLADAEPRFREMFDQTRITCFSADQSSLLMWAHYADGLRGLCVAFDPDVLRKIEQTYIAAVEYLGKPPIVDSFVYAVAEDQYDYHMQAIEELDGVQAHTNVSERYPGERESYALAAKDAFQLMTFIWQQVFAAKPLEWKYECEQRLLIRSSNTGRDPTFFAYPSEAITEIIIGERMPESFREELSRAVLEAYGDIPIRTAVRSKNTYEVLIV